MKSKMQYNWWNKAWHETWSLIGDLDPKSPTQTRGDIGCFHSTSASCRIGFQFVCIAFLTWSDSQGQTGRHRQTPKLTNRQTGQQTAWQKGRVTNRQADRQTCKCTHTHIDSQTDQQIDQRTNRDNQMPIQHKMQPRQRTQKIHR